MQARVLRENLAHKSLFSVQIIFFFVLSAQILIEKIEVNNFKSTGKDLNGFCLLCPLESSDHIQFIMLYIVAGVAGRFTDIQFADVLGWFADVFSPS